MHEQHVRFILASGSPRRRRLLENVGVSVEVRSVHVDEGSVHGATPGELVMARARLKAEAVAQQLEDAPEPALVLGADTVVVLDGAVLGKPADGAGARAMLHRLAGRTHRVVTGVALRPVGAAPGWPPPPDMATVDGSESEKRWADGTLMAYRVTEVTMGPLTGADVAAYAATGEPLDKAGAYGIQGRGGLLIQHIAGDYFNIVGLPLYLVRTMAAAYGVDLLSSVVPFAQEG